MTKPLFTLIDNVEVHKFYGDLQIPVSGVTYDSRRVEAGNLFVALHGTHVNGGDFIGDAIRRGAHVIVGEDAPDNHSQVTFLQVADSRTALARIGVNFYENPSKNLRLIGVTGTNGKTTTTHLIESILQHAGSSVGVLGTLAYRWADKRQAAPMTTPESLDLQRLFREMHDDGVTDVVMEVSSHALALGRVDGCLFDAGVFTNLSQDHLDFHGTMAEYFSAKTLLFNKDFYAKASDFVSIINMDDAHGKRLSEGIQENLWGYSTSDSKARVWVRQAELNHSGIQTTLATPYGDLKISSPLLGGLNLYNLLAAATTALALGISREAVSEGLGLSRWTAASNVFRSLLSGVLKWLWTMPTLLTPWRRPCRVLKK